MSANGTSDEVVRSEPGLNHLKCVSLVQGVQKQLEHVTHSPMPRDEHRPNPDQLDSARAAQEPEEG